LRLDGLFDFRVDDVVDVRKDVDRVVDWGLDTPVRSQPVGGLGVSLDSFNETIYYTANLELARRRGI